MRLFVAIYPSPEALDDVAGQAARLRIGVAAAAGTNVRLAARETLHLTLAFLGDVDEERLPLVQAALGRAADFWRRGNRAERPERGAAEPDQRGRPRTEEGANQPPVPPRLRLGGGGRFGRGPFTVLWVGVQGDLPALHALHSAVRWELHRHRLPYDRRPYRPHLTLARPGDRVDRAAIEADRDTLHNYLGPSWPVTEIVLVRSVPGPLSRHDRLAAWPI